ncbi:hypothetical protein VII00023_01760 [Vibrio ichthyoenteri ATCC 700023]|uniref:Uncharacterized protein n=1 Tax=Vibrio ichthyoenteri ATCC 700023 TaxID=870968 RepID=F9S333_9VIBR|nr:hypothetical protein VII00023_01760 [Vibrio ichthyoenteri ATCC 700023]
MLNPVSDCVCALELAKEGVAIAANPSIKSELMALIAPPCNPYVPAQFVWL